MFPDISFYLSVPFVLGGLYVLGWSADRFIDGASVLARVLGISPFIVGMVIIGFGTSAPELFVSALSGIADHSDLSLGNAFGSCIFNIAVILGIAALIRPIRVKPAVAYVAVPLLVGSAVLSAWLAGGGFTRLDGVVLLVSFAVAMPLYCFYDQRQKKDGSPEASGTGVADVAASGSSIGKACLNLFGGLLLLAGSSHLLVWGCVDLARTMGVSELLIGLTVVAAGTSLPELASAVVAARKGESELVLGNIVGSNVFNTLGVVGLAGTISPFRSISPYVLARDLPVMLALSLSIWLFSVNFRLNRRPGIIGCVQGTVWVLFFLVYLGVMICQEMHSVTR